MNMKIIVIMGVVIIAFIAGMWQLLESDGAVQDAMSKTEIAPGH